MVNRRTVIQAGLAAAAAATTPRAVAAPHPTNAFPKNFLWGAATAGHQVEGNNVNSDQWLLENVLPKLPLNPSGDACNSFELWNTDLDIARKLELNCYRFSIEWPRIEPEPGTFSLAMLDHYQRIIQGCAERGLRSVVTLCHFTTPRWFAARGGWAAPDAPDLFARYCERAMRHFGPGIRYVATLNEPNDALLLQSALPPPFWAALRASLAACAKASGTARFSVGNTVLPEEVEAVTRNMLAGHRLAKQAIKAIVPNQPVSVTLAMLDDQVAGSNSVRDARRNAFYGVWLKAAADDDYVGVQNYERAVWDSRGRLPPPPDVPTNYSGAEIFPESLANVVRHVHAQTKVPVLITEHGVGTPDDALRSALIPAALRHLKAAIQEGVPVIGYIHWSLLDNYEWGGDPRAQFGLVAVDRSTFQRTLKGSARVLSDIARRNSV